MTTRKYKVGDVVRLGILGRLRRCMITSIEHGLAGDEPDVYWFQIPYTVVGTNSSGLWRRIYVVAGFRPFILLPNGCFKNLHPNRSPEEDPDV